MRGWDVAPAAWDGVSSTCGECGTSFCGHGCPGCGQLADATDHTGGVVVLGPGLVQIIAQPDTSGYGFGEAA